MNNHKFIWADIDYRIHGVSPMAHNLLVRKCERRNSDFLFQDADNVEIPELPAGLHADPEAMLQTLKRHMPINWCEILAVGPKCGTRRTKEEMRKFLLPKEKRTQGRKYLIPWHVNTHFQVGDLVVLPEVADPGLMYRGATGNSNDLIVDESLIFLSIPAEK